MLTSDDKCLLYSAMLKLIARSPEGINTRTLVDKAIDALAIPAINYHHCFGMLSFLLRSCGVYFVVRSPGLSIVTI
mgnify:CR=1 FL=1